MSAEEVLDDAGRRQPRYQFDRHAPGYRHQSTEITQEMQAKCPLAWSDTHGGHWVAAGQREVFALARAAEYLSNDHDIKKERRGYQGISIPAPVDAPIRGGFLEMDPPEQRYYRQLLNPYLSPAAVARWTPVVDELARACLDEKIKTGRIAPGDGRTISADCEIAGKRFKEGERLYLSWAMANRDPSVFPNPNEIDMARTGNRHASFGLGIHRCIGSNMARMVFKRMVTAVLDRMPDYRCDPAGTVHYESIGVIQGMQHLPATFAPGARLGAGLEETIETLQKACDEQRLAEPVTVRKARAKIVG
jgi:cytochrome P450